MNCNFQNDLGRIIQQLLDECKLDEERLEVKTRPLYYSKYKYTFGINVNIEQFIEFESIKKTINRALRYIAFITSNESSLYIYVYSNSPEALEIVGKLDYDITYIHIIDKRYWDRVLPAPKPKGLYYDKFPYRVQFDSRIDVAQFEMLTLQFINEWRWSHTSPHKYAYIVDRRDLIMAKLGFTENIVNITERKIQEAS